MYTDEKPAASIRQTSNTVTPIRKPTVVILGTKGDQPSHLATQLNSYATLRFVETCKGKNPTIPRQGDLYVLWARFCSHSTQSELFNVAPKERCIIHHGGLNQMAAAVVKRLRGTDAH